MLLMRNYILMLQLFMLMLAGFAFTPAFARDENQCPEFFDRIFSPAPAAVPHITKSLFLPNEIVRSLHLRVDPLFEKIKRQNITSDESVHRLQPNHTKKQDATRG